MCLLIDTSGYLVAGTDDGTFTFQLVRGATDLMDGHPHLVGSTWNQVTKVLTAYQDGDNIGSVTVPSHGGGPTQYPICGTGTAGYSGAIAGNYLYFTGKLQSYVIWHRALTDADMSALFTATGI
jgi:hypothetical protein